MNFVKLTARYSTATEAVEMLINPSQVIAIEKDDGGARFRLAGTRGAYVVAMKPEKLAELFAGEDE